MRPYEDWDYDEVQAYEEGVNAKRRELASILNQEREASLSIAEKILLDAIANKMGLTRTEKVEYTA